MSNWYLIPLGQPESPCRTDLRVSTLKGWEAGLFLQLLPVTGSGLPQRTTASHFQPATLAVVREHPQEMQLLATGSLVALHLKN